MSTGSIWSSQMANPENIQGQGFHTNPERMNLAGRPKGARNRSTIYREHLEKVGKKGQVVDDIVLAAIDKALTGDINALKELMDSGYGKIPDKVLTAETEPENLDRDISAAVLKKLSDEDLQEIISESSKTALDSPPE